MRLLSTIAIAGLAATVAGCATSGHYSRSDIATSTRTGWGPHGKPLYYFMVMSNPTPGKDDDYNRWYDRIHAPVVIERGNFIWAQRFELSPKHFGYGTPQLTERQYMVIFAIETDDLDASLAEVNKRLALPRNAKSDAMDYRSLQSVSWRALGPPTTQQDAVKLLAEETAAGHIPPLDEKALSEPTRPLPGLGTLPAPGSAPSSGGAPPPGSLPPAAAPRSP